MKKILIIVLTAIIFLGAGAGLYFYFSKPAQSLEDFLAEKPLLYFHVHDFEKRMEELSLHPLIQGLKSIDYEKILNKLNSAEGVLSFFRQIQREWPSVYQSPVYKKFFSQEIAFVIYPSDINWEELRSVSNASLIQYVEKVFSGLILVTRLAPDAQLAEFSSQFIQPLFPNISSQTIDYKNHQVHILTIPKQNLRLGYVRLNDFLVLGLGERAAKMAVDVVTKEKTALAEDPFFSKAREKFLAASKVEFYLDLEQSTRLFKDALKNILSMEIAKKQLQANEENTADESSPPSRKPDREEIEKKLNEALGKMAGYQTLSFSLETSPEWLLKSTLFVDTLKMEPYLAKMFSCPPTENKTAFFVPKDVLGYQWSNCFNVIDYWQQLKKEVMTTVPAGREGDILGQIEQMDSVLGMSFENELLPALGDEVGGYLKGINLEGGFPLPEFLFFMKIKDKNIIENMFAQITNQGMFAFQLEQYQGVDIRYLFLPIGEQIQPAYCYLDDYLLVSINRDVLKKALDAKGDQNSAFMNNEDFKSTILKEDGPYNSLQFFKIGELMKSLRNLIGVGNDWVTGQEEKKAAFLNGSTKRLEDVQNEMNRLQEEKNELASQIEQKKADLLNLNKEGVDLTTIQAEIQALEEQAQAKQQELEALQAQQIELEGIVKDYERNAPKTEEREFYLENLVYPLLRAVESINILGGKSFMRGGFMESILIIK